MRWITGLAHLPKQRNTSTTANAINNRRPPPAVGFCSGDVSDDPVYGNLVPNIPCFTRCDSVSGEPVGFDPMSGDPVGSRNRFR
jgi:hypothetical protein